MSRCRGGRICVVDVEVKERDSPDHRLDMSTLPFVLCSKLTARSFFPVILQALRQTPVIGTFLSLPYIRQVSNSSPIPTTLSSEAMLWQRAPRHQLCSAAQTWSQARREIYKAHQPRLRPRLSLRCGGVHIGDDVTASPRQRDDVEVRFSSQYSDTLISIQSRRH